MAVQSVKVVPLPKADHDQQEPITLGQAANAINRVGKQWVSAETPTPEQWASTRHRLARAELAVSGLIGATSVLREHHFAGETATDCETTYIGITDFQAGGLSDAVEALAWLAQDSLSSAREVLVTGGSA